MMPVGKHTFAPIGVWNPEDMGYNRWGGLRDILTTAGRTAERIIGAVKQPPATSYIPPRPGSASRTAAAFPWGGLLVAGVAIGIVVWVFVRR